jgi:tetratricopeptide (TPR) repeat protein
VVVLADFDNKTGDAVFDDTLRQGLAVQLEQSPFLSLVSQDRIQQILQMMGKPADIRLSLSIAREVCQRTGSSAVLIGSIAQIGSRYLMTLEAVNCINGDSLASTEAQAIDKNHVLDALGKTASEIRNRLGESLSTVQKFDTPLVLATTSSLEALKAFSAGTRVMSASGDAAALPFLKHAVELDPSFALAYAWLGIAHTSIGEPGIAASYTRKAYELRSRTSEPERYFISTIYSKEVTGNIKAAEQSCQSWGAAYPRMDTPHFYLSGAIFPVTGQYERAVEQAKEAIRLNPDSPVSYAFLMFDETALGRFDEAKAAYKQAVNHKFNIPFFQLARYEIAFLEDDRAAMDEQAALSQGKSGDEDVLLSLQAETAAYRGRLKKAREISQRAIDSAERSGQRETTATYIAQSSLREALFGNAEEARQRAGSAIDRSTGRDAQYGAALALAFLGDDRLARSLTSDLARRFPEDTIVQFNYLPTLRAELAVSRGHALEAIETLEIAAPYELGATTASSYGWNAMYPVFVRGEAYLAARKGSEAAAEFQRIIDHRGIVVNEPIGAIAHLGLARAYVSQANTAKARAAYQDFFALWKDADSDIPILKQARDEYARLK